MKEISCIKAYYYKKIYSIGLAAIFVICAALGIKIYLNGNNIGILLSILSCMLAYIFYKVNIVYFITEEGIKKRVFNKEENCNWKWIYEINTEISSITGNYSTVINWSKLDKKQLEEYLSISNKCNEDVGKMIITSHVAGYKQLLQEIISRNAEISLDETTAKLVGK